ncbi:MAG: hypothetical protein AAF958_07025 [Planctomycetota bacterium]
MRKPGLAALVISIGAISALPFRNESPVLTSNSVPPPAASQILIDGKVATRAEPSRWVRYEPGKTSVPRQPDAVAPRWNPPPEINEHAEIDELPRFQPNLPPDRPRNLPLTFDDLLLPLDTPRPIASSEMLRQAIATSEPLKPPHSSVESIAESPRSAEKFEPSATGNWIGQKWIREPTQPAAEKPAGVPETDRKKFWIVQP